MATHTNCEGPIRLPHAMAQAVVCHAERQADLVAIHIHATKGFDSRTTRLPAAFFLELAAVLELGLWERRDLLRHVQTHLPTYRQAADQLVARCQKGREEFDGPNATPLSIQVLRVWLEHFAWDGPEQLCAEVVLGDMNEDDFIDLLADFVWTHRHELEHLILKERQQ